MNTYERFPVVLRKGRDECLGGDGTEYIDFWVALREYPCHCIPRSGCTPEAGQSFFMSLIFITTNHKSSWQSFLWNMLCGQGLFLQFRGRGERAAIKLARKYAKENMSGNVLRSSLL